MAIYKREVLTEIFKLKSKLKKTFLFSMVLQNKTKHRKKTRRRRHRYRNRDRGFAIAQMENLDEKTFKKMFRMSKSTFNNLLEKVSPLLQVDEQRAINSSGSVITAKTKLASTLRWLAGGIYLDICFAWGISTAAFYRCSLWPTVHTIDKVLKLGFPVGLEALSQLASGFNRQSNGIMNGCVMAIDGLLVRTRKPYKHEVKNPVAYKNRKGGFGVLLMAGCDADARFLMSVINNSGGTHVIKAVCTWESSFLQNVIVLFFWATSIFSQQE